MNDWLPIIIMMNNYFHDVATALLVTSAVAMLALGRILEQRGLEPGHPVHRTIYTFLSRLALAALGWIIIGGIPRTIFFQRFEWWDAASKGIVAALVVKHIVMGGLVIAGVVLWLRIRRRLKQGGLSLRYGSSLPE